MVACIQCGSTWFMRAGKFYRPDKIRFFCRPKCWRQRKKGK